jgi:iron complex outermembrane recepter protein
MKRSTQLRSGSALAALVLLTASPVWAQEVPAAATNDGPGEIIIVTARKTAENIQSIPVSVTAVTAETIAKLNIQGLTDVARFTPGFSFENYSGAFSAPIIRGQTQTRIDLAVQNTATFFNGIYLQRGYMVDGSLLEVERIEVIKGPQSALYGRNAFSGAINYITARPGDELKIKASTTIGSDDRFDVKFSVVLPLIEDKLSTIFAFGSSQFDGTWTNSHPLASLGSDRGTSGNLGGWDKNSYLIGAVFKPVKNLAFDVAYTENDIHSETLPSYTISNAATGGAAFNSLNCSPLPGLPGVTGLAAVNQNRLYCGTIPVNPVLAPGETRLPGYLGDPRGYGQDGKTSVLSGKVTWDINDDISLTYQYGKAESNVTGRGAPARDPINGTISAGTATVAYTNLINFDSQPWGDFESTSHEARIEWTPGGFLRRALIGAYSSDAKDNAQPRAEYLQPNGFTDTLAYFSLGNTTRLDDVTGYFGLATIDPTPNLSITGEIRYTEESLTLQTRATPPGDVCLIALVSAFCPATLRFYYSSQPVSDATILRSATNTFDYWTPRLTTDYKLRDDSIIYGSVAKGVKSGGQVIPGLDPLQDVYLPEENWTYEFGTKNLFFDKRLRLNAAVFYIDWTGIQGSVSRNYPASGRVLGVSCFAACAPPTQGTPAAVIIGNLGDATVKGIELEGSWFATDDWRFDYAFSYVDPVYKDGQISKRAATAQNCDGIVCATSTFNAQGQPLTGANIGGNTLERTPKIKLSGGVQYDWDMPSAGIEWSARADVTYQGEQFVDELNLASVPSRTLLDASLSATRGKLTGRFWVKNLTDEEYVSSAFFLIGTGGTRLASYVPFVGEKRTMGLTLSVQY